MHGTWNLEKYLGLSSPNDANISQSLKLRVLPSAKNIVLLVFKILLQADLENHC